MRAHDIPMAADGMPLERYMRRAYPLCDAAMLRRALAHRDFKQDGTRLNGSARVRGGAHIECFMADEYLLGAPLEVLCREERLAAVIKPAGLTCQRDAQGVGEDTLESRVRDHKNLKSYDLRFFNGQRWIRTIEASCSRFTVCPLWPLGNLPMYSDVYKRQGLTPIALDPKNAFNWQSFPPILIVGRAATPTFSSPRFSLTAS